MTGIELAVEIIVTVLSILAVLWFEGRRKPKLSFRIGKPGEIKEGDPSRREPAKWTHIVVHNARMPGWLSWAFNRNPAMSCGGWIEFFTLDGQPLFDGKKMDIRWSDSPQPLILGPDGVTGQIDWERMRTGHLFDIPPGADAPIDVVFRAKRDEDCYGWNNESYLHAWRNPSWKLGQGRYLAKITILTGGEEFTHTVEIVNEDAYEDFDLVPASRQL
jgi:hypothetical protein